MYYIINTRRLIPMPRESSVSYQEVDLISKTIEAEGGYPSVDAVYGRIGRGRVKISEFLRQRRINKKEQEDMTSSSFSPLLVDTVKALQNALQTEADQKIHEIKEDTKRILEEKQVEIETMESGLKTIKAELAKTRDHLKQILDANEQLTRQLRDADFKITQLTEKTEGLKHRFNDQNLLNIELKKHLDNMHRENTLNDQYHNEEKLRLTKEHKLAIQSLQKHQISDLESQKQSHNIHLTQLEKYWKEQYSNIQDQAGKEIKELKETNSLQQREELNIRDLLRSTQTELRLTENQQGSLESSLKKANRDKRSLYTEYQKLLAESSLIRSSLKQAQQQLRHEEQIGQIADSLLALKESVIRPSRKKPQV